MSSDDEDLKRAIALSLADVKKRGAHCQDPIVISSDDDSDVVLASKPEPSASSASMKATTTTSTFLSERAELEAARLERVKRRMRESSRAELRSTSSSSKSKAAADEEDPFVSSDEDLSPPSKKHKKLEPSKRQDNGIELKSRVDALEQPLKCDLFWAGEVRQTANRHVEAARDTRPLFRLHDILGDKSALEFCILSSYVTQLAWIYSLIPPTIPVLLVGQPGEDGAASIHNVLPNWVKVTPRLRAGRGCMHIKLMLLFYKTGRLRVVIPTANLMDYDWRDIENSVWVQDVRRRSKPLQNPKDNNTLDDFGPYLENVLDALNVPQGLKALRVEHPNIPLSTVRDLRKGWCFDQITAKLVASLAGKHEGWPSAIKVGHLRLMRIIKDIGACADAGDDTQDIFRARKTAKSNTGGSRPKRTLHLECQTSSVGTYTPGWIAEFFNSARGSSPEAWLDMVKTKRVKQIEGRPRKNWWPDIKILFPSLNTVLASRLGVDGADTMFCRRAQWEAAKFPRELFHDSNSKRGQVLMHSKMILATLRGPLTETPESGASVKKKLSPVSADSSETEVSDDSGADTEYDDGVVGWAYVGSHNFTPSAWGTLSGSGFNPVMNITNYELGVVFPLRRPARADEVACWMRPPRKYGLGVDEPWIQS